MGCQGQETEYKLLMPEYLQHFQEYLMEQVGGGMAYGATPLPQGAQIAAPVNPLALQAGDILSRMGGYGDYIYPQGKTYPWGTGVGYQFDPYEPYKGTGTTGTTPGTTVGTTSPGMAVPGPSRPGYGPGVNALPDVLPGVTARPSPDVAVSVDVSGPGADTGPMARPDVGPAADVMPDVTTRVGPDARPDVRPGTTATVTTGTTGPTQQLPGPGVDVTVYEPVVSPGVSASTQAAAADPYQAIYKALRTAAILQSLMGQNQQW